MDLLTVETLARPVTDDDVRALQPTLGPDRHVLGGGTWLFSVPQPHLRGLVDLTARGWPAVVPRPDGGLEIAATATLAALADHAAQRGDPTGALITGCCEALVGSRKVWNVATVGGNVCLALPAGPMTTMACALDGVAVLWPAAGGERRVPVAEFVVGPQRTAIGPGEVLRAIELPAAALAGRTAVRKAALSPLGRSAAMLAGRVDADGAFTLAVTAAIPRPAVLRHDTVPDAATLAAEIDALGALGWYDDPHGSPAWRRAMALHLAEEIRTELSG